MKGCKVSDANRNRTVGVACQTLDELKVKGSQKLCIKKNVRVQLLDGTFVNDEDYFQTLPSQTVFLLLKPGESAFTGADILYNALQAVNLDYLRAGKEVQKFFTQNVKEKVMNLAKLLNKASHIQNVQLSKKADDPDWFEGTESRSATKEEFMARRSQDRIRGYMYKTQDDLKKSEAYQNDQICQKKLTEALQEMNLRLKANKYFRDYFDRSAVSDRLCDSAGTFQCKGRWDLPRCRYKGVVTNHHMINPYASRESRIVFSTWNFDHVVERSRSIVPAFLEAAKLASNNNTAINTNYFYRLLFTTDNLKLVHIVCHDKGAHNVQCDPCKFTVSKSVV
ncbi:DNA fragmentation factor subunit beta [Zootermopsis nevadensis]|uniref:DNAation factor subunit beta n=1 Tax=Zootermopsis nevadensis TaxID=136037 RepID=A0A067QYQ3_ZOONE|nr:DNA fragmentation factor subunit beta [Zootermopsis nevadensis]KDR15630.1 DNA fragmentation factor subunit beta [Zootermopsis nevadensis]